jgi:hypothetical protein
VGPLAIGRDLACQQDRRNRAVPGDPRPSSVRPTADRRSGRALRPQPASVSGTSYLSRTCVGLCCQVEVGHRRPGRRHAHSPWPMRNRCPSGATSRPRRATLQRCRTPCLSFPSYGCAAGGGEQLLGLLVQTLRAHSEAKRWHRGNPLAALPGVRQRGQASSAARTVSNKKAALAWRPRLMALDRPTARDDLWLSPSPRRLQRRRGRGCRDDPALRTPDTTPGSVRGRPPPASRWTPVSRASWAPPMPALRVRSADGLTRR